MKKVLSLIALCGLFVSLAACSKPPAKGEINQQEVKNKPGQAEDGSVNTNDSATAAIE
ncbi:MAG: hypothetical protein R3C03_14615 [Pirellulaceae bacterium]